VTESVSATAIRAIFDRDSRSVGLLLSSGCTLVFPIAPIPELAAASLEQLEKVTVGPDGLTVRWESLGAHMNVRDLMIGATGIVPHNVPPGWGEDRLTAFFDLAQQHAFAISVHYAELASAIIRVDHAFDVFVQNWINPEIATAASFVIRAHASYRAAAWLAMCGQLSETYAGARATLEQALYANVIGDDLEKWKIWAQRGENEKTRKKSKALFNGSALFEALHMRSERLSGLAHDLYELTIDHGAHPNPAAVWSSMEMTETVDGGRRFEHDYIAGDGDAHELALVVVVRIGLVSLDIFCRLFPRRCDAVNIDEIVSPLLDGRF
jgi:Protein of unknown function (DUF2442)